MNNSFGIAWRQLSHQPMKLMAAAAGVVVAVMLMLVQLGIRQGAIDNSVSFATRIESQLVVVSPRNNTIFQSAQFPRRLLYRLPADPDVARVAEVYMGQARWKNRWENFEHPILVYGVEPTHGLLRLPGFEELSSTLELADTAVFDRQSRTTFGPVVETLETTGPFETEVNGRRIRIAGHIAVGVSITTDGNMYCNRANFLRMFPNRDAGSIDLGLVELKPGVDPDAAVERLQALLGREAIIMTQPDLVTSEVNFLRETAPIDFIFGMGAVVGFFIGFVVVYQILYTEVTNHLPQLATMKAMGFTDRYLLKLVLWQSVILSTLGYLPGFFLALGLYEVAERQIQMPFSMTWERGISIWLATLGMCCLSAIIAVRKAWAADPAEVF